MTWVAIARKDFHSVTRPRGVRWGLLLVASLFVIGGYLLPTATPEPTTADFTGYMTPAVVLVVPLFGLLLGYKAVVAERASGQLALLLSLPHSRLGAVLAKFVARGSVLVGVVGAGVLLGSALVAYPFGSFQADVFAGYLLLTGLYGLSFVGVGLALSTLTASNRLATAATFLVYFAFAVLWPVLPDLVSLALASLGRDPMLSDPMRFVLGLEPGMLYRRLVRAFFEGARTGPYLGPGAAWYLGAWPALAALCAWVALPVLAGYWRFRGTDL